MPLARDASPLADRERRRALLRFGLRPIIVGSLLLFVTDATAAALGVAVGGALSLYAVGLAVRGRSRRLQDVFLLLGDVPSLLLIVHFTPHAYAAEAVVPVWLVGVTYANLRRGAPALVPLLALLAWAVVASHAPATAHPLPYLAVQTLAVGIGTAVSLALAFERSGARRDALTGVLARRPGLDEVETMLAKRGAWVAFVDLRGFKAVNDRYGHQVGDEVLTVVGRRLGGVLRRRDVILRYGGDEFVIASGAAGLEPRLRLAFREPVATSAGPIPIDGRIGVIRAEAGTPLHEVVAEADRRMYRDAEGRGAPTELRPLEPVGTGGRA